jgi:hypothetical protein
MARNNGAAARLQKRIDANARDMAAYQETRDKLKLAMGTRHLQSLNVTPGPKDTGIRSIETFAVYGARDPAQGNQPLLGMMVVQFMRDAKTDGSPSYYVNVFYNSYMVGVALGLDNMSMWTGESMLIEKLDAANRVR